MRRFLAFLFQVCLASGLPAADGNRFTNPARTPGAKVTTPRPAALALIHFRLFQTGATLSSLASVHRERNKYSRAEDLLLQALDLFGKAAGEEHPHSALIMESLAELY
jgi:hypothetical protein